MSVWDLLQQARELARWVAEYRADQLRWRESMLIRPNEVTVAEMMAWLRDRFAADGREIDGSALLHERPTVSHSACTFLAMLELARNREITTIQDEPFGKIRLIRPQSSTS